MDCIKIFSVVRIFCFSEQSGRKSVSKESEQTEGGKKILRNFQGIFNSKTLVYLRMCFKSMVFK